MLIAGRRFSVQTSSALPNLSCASIALRSAQHFFLTSFTSSSVGIPIPVISIGASEWEDGVGLWKNDGRGDRHLKMTGVNGRSSEGFGVAGMDERGRLGVQSSKGGGDVVAFRMASARTSRFWEGDVEGPVTQGGTGSIGGGTGRGGVEDCETGLWEELGGAGNSPWLTIIGVFGGDKISMLVSFSTSPAMASSVAWGDDRREKGYSAIPVDAFAGVDC